MKKLVSIILFLIITNFAWTQNHWQKIISVDDVCIAYPEQIEAIFKSLNMDYPGLEDVKKAYLSGDLPVACKYLLTYYGKTQRVVPGGKLPGLSDKTDPEAELILQDTYSFQGVGGKAPRLDNGRLNWSYKGPRNDIEWAWALNRHYPVRSLFDAYEKTGNIRYVQYIDSFVKDWIISSWPYPAVKSNTAMCRGLEVSFREKMWARVFFELFYSEQISQATLLLILSSLPDHAHYSRYFHAGGNWLTMEISGLATVAGYWPEFRESSSWMDYAVKTMVNSMEGQVYPDGVQTELSSSYHLVALSNFSLFADICRNASVTLPAYYTNTITDMWNYLAWTIRPNGFGLLNNDSDLTDNRKMILDKAGFYNRPEWTYIASNGQEGTRPPEVSCFFPWAGQLISRNGFDADAHWSFFDMGPWGTGHQHNDKLHLSVSAYGRDLLVDAGRFAYTGEIADKFRKYALGSQGHNVILVDKKGQAEGSKTYTEAVNESHYHIGKDFDYGSATFDNFKGIEGKFVHTRSVVYVRDKFWIVADRLETDQPRDIEILWHWHPECKINTGSDGSVSTVNDYGNLKIIPVGKRKFDIKQVKGQEVPDIQGWYSSVYNTYEPAPVSIYSAEQVTDDVLVWILWPSKNDMPKLKTKILSKQKTSVTVRVTEMGKASWDITIPFLDKNYSVKSKILRN